MLLHPLLWRGQSYASGHANPLIVQTRSYATAGWLHHKHAWSEIVTISTGCALSRCNRGVSWSKAGSRLHRRRRNSEHTVQTEPTYY
jgi:hypothetical protein